MHTTFDIVHLKMVVNNETVQLFQNLNDSESPNLLLSEKNWGYKLGYKFCGFMVGLTEDVP